MSVQAPEDMELFSLLVSDPADPEPCAGEKECPNETVFRAWWKAGCTCVPNPNALCLPCRDRVYAMLKRYKGIICEDCHAEWILLRIEPLPR